MSKLLQIGIVGAVLYYLWDQQQKKGGNGQQTSNGQQCESDLAEAKRRFGLKEIGCIKRADARICPTTGKRYTTNPCVAKELDQMGWEMPRIKFLDDFMAMPMLPEEEQRKMARCKSDIRRANEMLTDEQRAIAAVAEMLPTAMICPNGLKQKVFGYHVVENLKKMGWKSMGVITIPTPANNYNSLIGLEGELL